MGKGKRGSWRPWGRANATTSRRRRCAGCSTLAPPILTITSLVELYTTVSPLTLTRRIDRRLSAMPSSLEVRQKCLIRDVTDEPVRKRKGLCSPGGRGLPHDRTESQICCCGTDSWKSNSFVIDNARRSGAAAERRLAPQRPPAGLGLADRGRGRPVGERPDLLGNPAPVAGCS